MEDQELIKSEKYKKMEPEKTSFSIHGFDYCVEYLNDKHAKSKSLLIEAEHDYSKRVWKKRIDDEGLNGNGINKIKLYPETLFKILKNSGLKRESSTIYKTIFPEKEKTEDSPLSIVIDIENEFPELCEQCLIILDPVDISMEQLLEKQIKDVRKIITKNEDNIYGQKNVIEEMTSKLNNLDERVKPLILTVVNLQESLKT